MSTKAIISLASLILLISCAKNQYKSDVSDSFREWTFFNKGSYWVYLNEGTSTYDTCRLYEKEKIYYNPDSPPQYEYIYLNVTGKFIQKYLIYRAKDGNSYLNLGIEGYYNEADVLSDLATQGYTTEVTKSCRVVAVHGNLTVQGNTFANVVQTRDSVNRNNGVTVLTDYYFAKKVGLIKWERVTDTSHVIRSLVIWHTTQ